MCLVVIFCRLRTSTVGIVLNPARGQLERESYFFLASETILSRFRVDYLVPRQSAHLLHTQAKSSAAYLRDSTPFPSSRYCFQYNCHVPWGYSSPEFISSRNYCVRMTFTAKNLPAYYLWFSRALFLFSMIWFPSFPSSTRKFLAESLS